MNNQMITAPKVILIIVCGLLIYGFAGLCAIFLLIIYKADPALIGLVAATTTGAIGNVSGMLNNTRTQAAPASNDPVPGSNGTPPVNVAVTNTDKHPVPVTQPAK